MLTAVKNATPFTREVLLPTGRLQLSVGSEHWSLDELCAFASRDNPKRGFLVVSRVLGRHLPVRPGVMRRSAHDLAILLPDGLPGPVMVVGLAETAVCLGQTLHEELRLVSDRSDVGFIHSTRQQVASELLCRFEEPHSHASAHLVYRPQIASFAPPRTLVIVDDEISTGTTVSNLTNALIDRWPEVERVIVATLTDWSSGHEWLDRMPRPAECVTLLSGRLHWTPERTVEDDPGFERRAGSLGRGPEQANHGRLGILKPISTMPVTPLPNADRPLRIVGTGEFTYLPFRLAERLEAEGRDVVVQATSRSPARLGAAMTRMLCFEDNYGTGVPNFLYNANVADGRDTWICHETPEGTVDPALVDGLAASVLRWHR